MKRQTTTDEFMFKIKINRLKLIIFLLCSKGFMNGWFGDTSRKYQEEQLQYLLLMSDEQLNKWIDANTFNLITYCGLTVVAL